MIVYDLPLPPSVNAMFASRGVKGAAKEAVKARRGRVKTGAYHSWSKQAGLAVMCQGPLKTHSGACHIRIVVSDRACGDLDNRCKAVLDFLVHHKIIKNDDKTIVRKILLEWGPVDGARVEITQAVMA